MTNLLGLLSPLWDFYERLDDGVMLLDEQSKPKYLNSVAKRLLNQETELSDSLSGNFITEPALDSPEFTAPVKEGKRKISGSSYLQNSTGGKTKTRYNCFCICDDVTGE